MKNLEILLEKVEPLTNRIIENTKEQQLKKGLPWGESDNEWVKLCIQHKLIGAITRYIKETDVIESTKVGFSGGNITARINTNRGHLNTEVIYAGGYNIQSLHTRYIIDTNLPIKGENKSMIKEIVKQKRQFKKLEEVKRSIGFRKNDISSYEKKLSILENMTKQGIVDASNFKDLYELSYSDLPTDRKEWIEKCNNVTLDTEKAWNDYKENNIFRDVIMVSHQSRIDMTKNQLKNLENALDKNKNTLKKLL